MTLPAMCTTVSEGLCGPPAGMQWYVDQALGTKPKKSKVLFYTEERVVRHFKHYVRKLITRKNTITGRQA